MDLKIDIEKYLKKERLPEVLTKPKIKPAIDIEEYLRKEEVLPKVLTKPPEKVEPKKPFLEKIFEGIPTTPLGMPLVVPTQVIKPTPPKVKLEQKLPSLDWLDKVGEIKKDKTKLVPFVSSGVEGYNLIKLLKSAQEFSEGKDISDEDLNLLKEYVDRSEIDTTWGYKVADVVFSMIPFAGEFIATGGIYAIGKTLAIKGVEKALRGFATKIGKEALRKKLATKIAAGVAGATLQAPFAGFTRIPTETIRKQLEGKLTGDEEAVWKSLMKATTEQWVEIVSERSGGLFKEITNPIKGALVKRGIFKAFQKANPTQSIENLRKVINRLGYHGVIEEMLEERAAEVGHGVLEQIGLGDQKFSLPTLEQLSVEMVAFAFPGVAFKVIESGMRKLPKPKIKPKVEPPVKPLKPPVEPPIPEKVVEEVEPEVPEVKPEVEPAEIPIKTRIYDEIEAEIKRIEGDLEKKGIDVVKMYDPTTHRKGDFPPDYKPMPENLAKLYREIFKIVKEDKIRVKNEILKKSNLSEENINNILEKLGLDEKTFTYRFAENFKDTNSLKKLEEIYNYFLFKLPESKYRDYIVDFKVGLDKKDNIYFYTSENLNPKISKLTQDFYNDLADILMWRKVNLTEMFEPHRAIEPVKMLEPPIEEVKPPEVKPAEIPKELELLAEEARKYKSAEEFSKTLRNKTISSTIRTDILGQIERLQDVEVKRVMKYISKEEYQTPYHRKLIEQYMELKTPSPPIEIMGKNITEGTHRLLAAEEKGQKTIKAWITEQNLTDFYNQAVKGKEPTIPPPEVKPAEIPKELELLAEEARKYKSAEEFGIKLDIEQIDTIASHPNFTTERYGKIKKEFIDLQDEIAKKEPYWLEGIEDPVLEKKYLAKEKEFHNEATKILTDFYNQAVKGKEPTIPPPEVKPAEIPKELQPLAEEAKKYKSAEEFASQLPKSVWETFVKNIYMKNLDNPEIVRVYQSIFHTRFPTQYYNEFLPKLTDFYNQAVKGVKEVKAEVEPPVLPPEKVVEEVEPGTHPQLENLIIKEGEGFDVAQKMIIVNKLLFAREKLIKEKSQDIDVLKEVEDFSQIPFLSKGEFKALEALEILGEMKEYGRKEETALKNFNIQKDKLSKLGLIKKKEEIDKQVAPPDLYKILEWEITTLGKVSLIPNNRYLEKHFKGEGVIEIRLPTPSTFLYKINNDMFAINTVLERLKVKTKTPEKIKKPVGMPISKEKIPYIVKKGEGVPPETLKNIGKQLVIDVNSVMREGRVRGGWRGFYDRALNLIRVRSKGEISVVAHEVGHHIDITLTKTKKLKLRREFMKELKGLISWMPENLQTAREGIAEFINLYVTNPENVKQRAPNFYNYFTTDFALAYPDIFNSLNKAQERVKNWHNLSATEKVKTLIEPPTTVEKRWWQKSLSEISADYFNQFSVISKYVANAKKQGLTVRDGMNAYYRAVGELGIGGKQETFLKDTIFVVATDEKGNAVIKEYGVGVLKAILPELPDIKTMSIGDRLKRRAMGEDSFTEKYIKFKFKVSFSDYLQDIQTYFASKRALVYFKREKKLPEEYTPEVAEANIKDIETRYGQDIIDIDKKVQQGFRDLLTIYLEEGKISLELYNKIKEDNWYYIPMNRIIEDLELTGGSGIGNILSQAEPIKRLKGGEQVIKSPLTNMIEAHINALLWVERERIKKSIVYLKGAFPQEIVKIPPDVKFMGYDKEGSPIFSGGFMPKGAVIDISVAGVKEWYEIPIDLYEGLQGADKLSTNIAMRGLVRLTKWFKLGATSYAPEFTVRNPIKDPRSASIFAKFGMPAKALIPMYNFVDGLLTYYKNPTLLKRVKQLGGDTGFWIEIEKPEYERLAKTYKKSTDKYYIEFAKMILSDGNYKLLNPLKILAEFARFGEGATRMMGYKEAIRRGANILEAMVEGYAESTLAFQLHGKKMTNINSVLAFFNPSLLGIRRILISFKERPLETSLKIGAVVGVPTTLLWLINHDDDDYKEMPTWRKLMFYNIKLDFLGIPILKGRFLPIPASPSEFIFKGIIESVLNTMHKIDPEGTKKMIWDAIKDFSPIGSWMETIPTPLRAPIEAKFNYDSFRNKPIVPGSLKREPAMEQWTPYTPQVYRHFSVLINKVSLRQFEVSPMIIQHLYEGIGAGFVKHIDRVYDIISGQVLNKPTIDIGYLPVLRAFITPKFIGSGSESVNRLYDKWENYTRRENRALDKERQKIDIEYLKENRNLRIAWDKRNKIYYSQTRRVLQSKIRELVELRKLQIVFHNSKTLTPDRKRERIDKISQRMTVLARETLKTLK